MATIARATVYAVLALIWVTPVGAQLATPEAATRAWLAARPLDRDSACVAGEDHVLAMSIALIDDRWARVFVTPCRGGPPDELWMLRVGEDWRIARLIRG